MNLKWELQEGFLRTVAFQQRPEGRVINWVETWNRRRGRARQAAGTVPKLS